MMLDQIDLDVRLSQKAYKEQLDVLQARLFDMEQALFEARMPALLIMEGWAGTAKVQTIRTITRRLDPRNVRVHAITPPRTYETQYPWLYRFWLKTPSYGETAIFDRSWYRQVVTNYSGGKREMREGRERCEDIVALERQLADDGVLIIKFFLHISRREQGRRFAKLRSDSLTNWQVTSEDAWQHRHYGRVRSAIEQVIALTDLPYAPWHLIAATDKRHARIVVMETILRELEARLGQREAVPLRTDLFDARSASVRRTIAVRRAAAPDTPDTTDAADARDVRIAASAGDEATSPILSRVALHETLDQKTYEQKLAFYQAKIHLLGMEIYRKKRPVVLVFEGWDAAGKGGAIQRLTEQLDPRGYTVHAIAAPSGDDKQHHYLYRFWRRLPPAGQTAIFDRSWYGRVLVERVEGFAKPHEWQRAYGEINDFERQLAGFGAIICKFWLHISQAEQLRRFEERQTIPYKAWKLTDEDWRNRAKWGEYEQATDDMLWRTSTPSAPWTVVEAEDKRFGRIKVLRTVVERLENELGNISL